MRLNRLEITHDALCRFDPRARLAAALLLILAAVRLSNYAALASIIAVCLLVLCRDIVCVIKRLVPLETFCALLLAQAAIGFMPVQTAAVFILRIQCAALLSMALAAPLGIGKITAALASFRLNPKLISILYLTYRYIFMMHDTVMCSIKAMRIRKPVGLGVWREWKCCAAVFASALLHAFDKADKVGAALSTRGFDGVIPRTAVWRWRARDTLLLASCGAACAVLVLLPRGYL